MRSLTAALLALATLSSTMMFSPAEAHARRWSHHHGGAIGLGIAGAVIGGLALRHRYYDDGYYGYYDDDYPYYSRRYYRPSYGFYGGYRSYGHHHRRGGGGPAWGVRGHGWSGRHHHH